MEERKKKNQIRMRFSTLLLCCLAILLCAAPALQAKDILVDQTEIIDDTVTGILWIYGTANLLTGASITQYIYVQSGGTLNMYSGTIGPGCFINVSSGAAGMTVYGTEFAVDGYPCDYGEVTLTGGRGTLTGEYGDESSIDLLILSDTPINLQPPPEEMEIKIKIDIKPGSELNKINLKSKGVIPVAVLTTGDFDAIDVDPATVVLAGASHVRWTMEDVDNDGDKDMLFHFKTQELNLDENITEAAEATKATETTLTLTGNKRTDVKIRGTDKVRIVSGKK